MRRSCLSLPVVLLALVIVFTGACSRRGPSGGVRNRVLPPFPVSVWIDWAGCGPAFEDPGKALEFCVFARRAGVTHLILEARTFTGHAALGESGVYTTAEQNLRAAARETGLRLSAVLPAFLSEIPPSEDERPLRARWDVDGGWSALPLASDLPGKSSPVSPSARAAEVAMVKLLASDTTIETIFLSGFGFEDAHADIGPPARTAYEQWRGGATRDWPSSVLGEVAPELPWGRFGRGPHWDSWVTWRARILRDLLILMRGELAQFDDPPRLAALVDAPYPAHQRQGLNWASPETMAEVEHDWLPQDYGRRTASGHLLDIVGLIFWQPDIVNSTQAEREGFAWWASLEGAGGMARRYRRRGEIPPWFVIPVRDGNGWESGVRGSRLLGAGLVLFPGSAFLDDAGRWADMQAAANVPLAPLLGWGD